MASSLSYVEFVLEQMSGAGEMSYRRMFGEYGLYCDGKYFGCICNDRVLIKITPAGEALVRTAPAYDRLDAAAFDAALASLREGEASWKISSP